MATYLIVASDFDNYRKLTPAISAKYEERVRPYVLEAQIADLRDLITKDFYNEVIEVAASEVDSANGKLTKVNYDLLLPYIKPVLAYYTWVRLIRNNQATITVNSLVRKTNEYSEPTTEREITRLANDAEGMARIYSDDLIKYLTDNKANFTTWRDRDKQGDTERVSVRISAVSND